MNFVKVRNMESAKGNNIANQFLIFINRVVYFQSYNTIVAKADFDGKLTLDNNAENYSRTTSKYLFQFIKEFIYNGANYATLKDFIKKEEYTREKLN